MSKPIPLSEYTLSDGTKWHAIADDTAALSFRVTNASDPSRELTSKQWNEYTRLYRDAARAKLKAARAERHAASKAAFERDIAARKANVKP